MHNIYIYIYTLGSLLITILSYSYHKEPVRIRSDTTITLQWYQVSLNEDFLQLFNLMQLNQGVSFVFEDLIYHVQILSDRNYGSRYLNNSSLQDKASSLGWHEDWIM